MYNSLGIAALLLVTCALPCLGQNATPGKQSFVVKGVVEKVEPDGKTVVIRHEAIPNYMSAMTMPFETRGTNILNGLKPGDVVQFHLVVTDKEGWIDAITNLELNVKTAPSETHIELARAVEPLDEGDMLPDYHFTNELGQAVHLGQFKGEPFAVTFFFTSCPFPDFCPRMTHNFADAEKRLEEMPNGPARWRLLSLSFDPTNDTPHRLLSYAQNAGYDPAHWSFLTGDQRQIGGLADQVGENYWREGGIIGHNLRTVVVDSSGRIRKILTGNKWTADDLVQLMVGK